MFNLFAKDLLIIKESVAVLHIIPMLLENILNIHLTILVKICCNTGTDTVKYQKKKQQNVCCIALTTLKH